MIQMSKTESDITIGELLEAGEDGIDIGDAMPVSKFFDKHKIPYYFSWPYGVWLRNSPATKDKYDGLIFVLETSFTFKKSRMSLMENPLVDEKLRLRPKKNFDVTRIVDCAKLK